MHGHESERIVFGARVEIGSWRESVLQATRGILAALIATFAGTASAQPSGPPVPAQPIPPAAERIEFADPPAPPGEEPRPIGSVPPPAVVPQAQFVPAGRIVPVAGLPAAPPPPAFPPVAVPQSQYYAAPSYNARGEYPPPGQPFGALLPAAVRDAAREKSGKAAAAVQRYENDLEDLQEELESKLSARRRRLFDELSAERNRLLEAKRFDEALEAHQAMRKIEDLLLGALDDPGNLAAFGQRIGRMFHFRVVGAVGEGVYGTDVYGLDSPLSAAAVHAGVLAEGEKGIVRVKIRIPEGPLHASTRHGVTSLALDRAAIGFTVEKP